MTLVKNDKLELAEALVLVTEEAQKAQQAAQGPPTTAGAAAAPAALAGLAGASPEGMSPIPGASQGQEDLAGLMAKLRQPAMTIKPMRGVAQGAV
jgi:hypothetical protein